MLLIRGLRYCDLWLGSLQDTVTEAGAEVSEAGIIETFDNDDEALDAVDNGVVVAYGLRHCTFTLSRIFNATPIAFVHLVEGECDISDVVDLSHFGRIRANFIFYWRDITSKCWNHPVMGI
ncbi:hypothetical protein CK203_095343 [Vitis vinifera]|uniref:Uncharacterized protein n=1 Tax=Vitis vinifera TaxID=29760 RepID=A0A438E749_VITVI|nr:hypothetical protein CK203_095343 [Vitis vinifera]